MAAVLACGGRRESRRSATRARRRSSGSASSRRRAIEVTRLSGRSAPCPRRQGPPAPGTQAGLVRALRRDPGHLAGADADRPGARYEQRDDGAGDQRGGPVRARPHRRPARGARRPPGRARGGAAAGDPRPAHLPLHALRARAGLPPARPPGRPADAATSVYLNGHEVDFYFPDLGLVVETDGLTYHRTPAQQAKDPERDQDHPAAGTDAAALHPRPDQIRAGTGASRILRATVASPAERST